MRRNRLIRHMVSNLFVVYAAASLVPVVLLGLVLIHGYQDQALRRGLEQGKAQAAVIQEMAIAPALHGDDLSEGLTGAELERLQSATDLAIFSGSVSRLRLRSFSGQVTFSDDGSTAGALPTTHPAFRGASAGRTTASIVRDPQAGRGQLIRVLQPVVANASGRATGVFEVYLPYDQIAAEVQVQTRHTVWQLAVGLAGLYMVLALIAWYTTRKLHRHAAEREHHSLHDGLTGLPNREWFRARAEDTLARSERSGENGAVVLVDLDRFKEVNDTLGHAAGDELLRVVGRRLSEALRTDDAVARLGGDEFGLVLPRVDADSVLPLLHAVRGALAEEIVLDGLALRVEASFGVALYPETSLDLEVLLQSADAAMYQGKRGSAGIVVHQHDTPAGPHTLTVQQEVHRALERDELVLHYQPKIDLESGRTCGVEALVRWQHPTRGLLLPGEFLPAVERSSLIEPLTAWVLRRALTDRRSWADLGIDWTVAVNVSARNLEADGLPTLVTALLAELHLPASTLHLEITETALALDPEVTARALRALTERGVQVAIDDFGVGYTSLSQLRGLSVAEIKIDRTFVTDLDRNPKDQAIVDSIIGLARGLGCRVTAEGVETEAVADWLTQSGCRYAQGYFFDRPLPWPELVRRAAQRQTILSERSTA
jgi:diguanylate cyclase (GGDEF)-like protein